MALTAYTYTLPWLRLSGDKPPMAVCSSRGVLLCGVETETNNNYIIL
jgi:hypothetical protein